MIRELLTLREIARRLDVPPSSIAYYKDRFARYLPAGEGRGRRLRYPVHVLDIFREIRSMYTRNVAAEQIEERLEELVAALSAPVGQHGQPGARSGARASGTGAEQLLRDRPRASDVMSGPNSSPGHLPDHSPDDAPRMADDIPADPAVEGLTGMLDRMATLLQVQGHMLAELSSLRRQVEDLRADRDSLLAAFDERAARLDEALDLLRRERTEAVTRLVDDYYTVVSGAAGAENDGAGPEGAAAGAAGDGVRADAAGAVGPRQVSMRQAGTRPVRVRPARTRPVRVRPGSTRPGRNPPVPMRGRTTPRPPALPVQPRRRSPVMRGLAPARIRPPRRPQPCSTGRWSSGATANTWAYPGATRHSPCVNCWYWWTATPPGGIASPWAGPEPALPGCCA